MGTFEWKGKHWRIVPFLMITATLLFFVFWIGSITYQYHLETEERRKVLDTNINEEAKKLNSALHEENIKLKKENDHLKSVPYELKRNNGEIEYYNLFTHKLVKRKNIDGSIEEFDANQEKYKETDKNGKVKFFKTKIYQKASDFKKLGVAASELRVFGYSTDELRSVGYSLSEIYETTDSELKISELRNSGHKLSKTSGKTAKELRDDGWSASDFIDSGYSYKELIDAGFTVFNLRDAGFTKKDLIAIGITDEGLKKLRYI